MASYDLLLAGGTVVFENGEKKANIAVKDGKIAAILAPGFKVDAEAVNDITGLYVFPGLIDTLCQRRGDHSFGDALKYSSGG